ncbi:hypothetical protein OG874_00720 [Nocardia sp. NBC_00565]|uniref:hypothetical protein n=1 Tax=Nocardia sp. NBC_00565 TaxID=2975993 RepID=UPI002E814E26|nr:hypothetical protein [Nocardia sp. NBC_00565]WUC03779.1 hypothetical protein OG874_00720 [Nocardia sp. NBC_00565]
MTVDGFNEALRADVLLDTGARPGEALAIRRCGYQQTTPTRTIAGAMVRTDTLGPHRQDWTETDEGYRIVILPGRPRPSTAPRREWIPAAKN